jgi:hypothetical protein
MLREGLSIGDLEYAGHVCKTFPRWQRDQLFRASPCDAPEDGILYCPNACDGVTVSLPPTPQFFGEPGRTIGAGRNSRTLSRRTGGSILRRESQSVAAREDLFCLNWRWAGSTRGGGAIEAETCSSSRARWNQCLRSRIRCAKLPSIRSRDIQKWQRGYALRSRLRLASRQASQTNPTTKVQVSAMGRRRLPAHSSRVQ